MKYNKLLLVILLPIVIVMLCSFEETNDFFRYEINENGEAEITAFVGERFSQNAKVPSEINGHPVTVIKESAFYNHPYLKSIEIPSSIVMIEPSAFAYCGALESVEFLNGGDKLEISELAFEMCTSLKSVKFSNAEIYIDDYSFAGCLMLGEIYFPENIKGIGYLAFDGCESIIFDCEENELAEKYAKDNNIPTNFRDSDDFLILLVVGISLFCFIVLTVIYKIIQKNKKHKKKLKKIQENI